MWLRIADLTVRTRLALWVLVSGACLPVMVWGADAASAGAPVGGRLTFSGEGEGRAIPLPEGDSPSGLRGMESLLNRGNSLGGSLESSTFMPHTSRAAVESRQAGRWQDRMSLDSGGWATLGADPVQGPSAADFERALGVRDFSGVRQGASSPAAAGGSAGDSYRRDGAASGAWNSRLDFRSDGLGLSSDSGATRSLDPVLDALRVAPRMEALSGSGGMGSMNPVDSLAVSTAGSQSDSRIRSDLFDPLGLAISGEPEVPRTVRGLIDSAPAAEARRENPLLLDQDSTRRELNPYLPVRREDFQFSFGDQRLGIEGRGDPASPQGRSSARNLSTTRSLGASSLAPALAIPTPDSGFTTPSRQAGQIQFPSRKF